jgi:DNA-directed RNA polymerase alpha subunit
MSKPPRSSESTMDFTIKNKTPAFVNGLRRAIISKVPTFAVEDVNVFVNDTDIIDEIIVERISLVPLTIDINTVRTSNYRSSCANCQGQGCSKCEVRLGIDIINDTSEEMAVYASDIDIYNGIDGCEIPFISEENETIPIVHLEPGQALKLKAAAIKNIGSVNTKWSPVGTAFYYFEPVVTIDEKMYRHLNDSEKEELIKSCPKSLFKENRITGNLEVNSKDCIYCGECEKVLEDIEDIVKVSPDEDTVHFTIESTGALSPKDILVLAVDSIKLELGSLAKDLLQRA